jgi:DNA-directed RNA polymerase specialized sigma24 family protein
MLDVPNFKDRLCEDILNSGIKDYCIMQEPHIGEDLFMDAVIKMLSVPERKLYDIYERGKHVDYFFLIARNTIYSYYKKKRIAWVEFTMDYDTKEEEYVETGNEIIDLIDEWSEDRESMWWYHSKLIKLYIESGSYRKLSVKTGIPQNSISFSVREFKNWVRGLCSDLKIEI